MSTELINIDPAWAACTADLNAAILTLPCDIYDPPKALSTAAAMVPGGGSVDPSAQLATSEYRPAEALQQADRLVTSVTQVNDPPATSTPAAAAANAGSPGLPTPTTVPSSGGVDPGEKSSQDVSDPKKASDPAAELLKLDPMAPSDKQADNPTSQSNSVQEGAKAPAADHQSSDSSNKQVGDPTSQGDSVQNGAKAAAAVPQSSDPSSKPNVPTSQSDTVQEGGQAPAADHQSSDPSTPNSNPSDKSTDPDVNASSSDISDQPSQKSSAQKEAPAPVSGSEVSDPKKQTQQGSSPNVQLAVPQAPTTINLGGGTQSTPDVGALINGGLGGGSVPAPGPPPSPTFTPHVVTALGQTLSITDPSAVAIAGSTLSVGGPAHTSNGKYYSLAPSGNLVAGTLAATPVPSPPPVLSVAGTTYTANAASEFIIAGQTLAPGGEITIASTKISLHPSADIAVVGDKTQFLATASPSPAPALLTFAGSTYTANAASQFVIASQTLTPGGTITASGTPIALPQPTNDIPATIPIAVIGSSTQTLATALTPPLSVKDAPVLTYAGSTYTADASHGFFIASQTLRPGGIITVLGTPISLASGAADAVAVVGTSTQTLATATVTPADVFTVGGTLVTAHPTGFAMKGTSVMPGGWRLRLPGRWSVWHLGARWWWGMGGLFCRRGRVGVGVVVRRRCLRGVRRGWGRWGWGGWLGSVLRLWF